MLAAVDRLFTTADFAFALSDFELAVEDILSADSGLIPPAGRSERLLFDDLLDDGLNGRRLGVPVDDGRTRRANRRRGNDAPRGASKKLSFTTCNLGLTDSDVALTGKESLCTLRSNDAPEALVLGCLPARSIGSSGACSLVRGE